MNRKERRKNKIKTKVPTYNLTADDIKKLKNESSKAAADKVFFMMVAIPVMVLHDKYPALMKRDGREQRFADMILELYTAVEDGYVTVEQLKQCLWDEGGIKIEQKK